jgi:hypothetical protein
MLMQMVFSLNYLADGGGLRLFPARGPASWLAMTVPAEGLPASFVASPVPCLGGMYAHIDRDLFRRFEPL